VIALLFLGALLAEIEPIDAPGFPKELQKTAVCATVKLTGPNRGGQGSGVIVGRQGAFVYVLTARHVVAGADRLEVAMFSPASHPKPAAVVKEAEVVARAKTTDLALVRFPWRREIEPLPIAPLSHAPEGKAFAALSVGCEAGQAPQLRAERVVDRKRVRKSDDDVGLAWELEKEGVAGRSGGPLLSPQGLVIGIASGNGDGKGYFTHISEAHAWLKGTDFEFLLQPAGP
jgi:S1-C subfamily serine protease